jgi:hypothetical protein
MIRANGDLSVFGWIDFSSEHREKVKTVIDLLAIPGVVDELGIGTIRDCFSDTLFPGISTIQTRAKYFLTLPRLLREYQAEPPLYRRRRPLADWLTSLPTLAASVSMSGNTSRRPDSSGPRSTS